MGRSLPLVSFAFLLVLPVAAGPLEDLEDALTATVAESLPAVVKVGSGFLFGSGVIVHPDGYVATNFRVANSGETPTVELSDGRVLEAPQVTGDARVDVAILKIDGAGPFPYLRLGDSDRLLPGDYVAVLGHPKLAGITYHRQHRDSVMLGIVNTRDLFVGLRSRPVYQEDGIWFDAATNPGAEGGGVIRPNGELIGINAQLQFDERTADEIAFAVPAGRIRQMLGMLEGYEDPPDVDLGEDPFAPLSVAYRAAAVRLAPSLVRIGIRWMEDALVSEDHAPGPFSGFVIRADGVILTSLTPFLGHGDRIDSIEVTMSDGRLIGARLLGRDFRRDIALLRLEGEVEDLPVPVFAPGDSVRVGRTVIALGTAFGPTGVPNLYAGIVSGLRREQNSVQTDAYLYHGNRGGPLADLEGRVIGPLVQLYEEAGEKSGVAFAIPMSEIEPDLDHLIAGRDIHYPELGILYGPPGSSDRGALVTYVKPGSPAEAAGVRPADEVVRCNGERVRNAVQLVRIVQTFRPRDRITLTLYRSGEELEVEVTLARRLR